MSFRSRKSKKGMAATEYILGLILVAVAAIGTFSVFGAQIKAKIAQVTAAMAGDTSHYNTIREGDATRGADAQSRGTSKVSMSGSDNIEYGNSK